MSHLKYLRYLIRHKWFVFVAGLRMGVPLWRLLVHDWSKFLPSEWIPYAQNFYWPHEKKNNESLEAFRLYGLCEAAPFGHFVSDRFQIAWNHHQKRQPHHWQYWLITMDSGETFPLPMPEVFAREMVADWMGAGRAITGKWEVELWYTKNRDRIKLRDETRELVERLMGWHAPAGVFA